ncbi:MAG TPA: 1,3-beta-galactosyl-N-acetylhexosamine phosphorylase [Bacillota bacterium]|nr:1,3-beta-galactosyl-N-acetylhexosamine phosphorylase [Bacillota bacterium]
MNQERYNTGSFTLPGEAGYEDLTIRLAQKWGADTIRDSDGTVLSDQILALGYNIYSTLCMVRADNTWARANPDKLQQNFLMSFPVVAESETVSIDLLKGYFRQQFVINTKDDPKEWWQVFDRTTGEEVSVSEWELKPATGMVTINKAVKWHKYTVNFLVYRIWEEISMYNHITNNWGDREHLMAVEPMYPETQRHLLKFLEEWLKAHPQTNVVRFTSMFYNFCWFWGDDPNLKYVYSDWASYDFTVNPLALKEFEKAKGYRLKSEDFVNNGLYNSTHNAPSQRYLDWMDFINSFVVSFGRKLIELVHQYEKKAYVFYDDHWIGVEPYSARFEQMNFDGIIKCVFNGFEARKCAGVKGVATHELRLHPYLFPTGLKGEPTFKEGGNPTLDCKNFWVNIRRALLRAPVDRIGLGGYLSLVQNFPDFIDYIEELTQEFRMLKEFHQKGQPYTLPGKVAVLTAWGKLRSWICSGHLHEHPELDLTNVIESLAGLPVDVEFISFNDIIKEGISSDVKVIINAGRIGGAWSGGYFWSNPELVAKITAWVAQGGGFIGIAEPSALQRSSQYFQLSHLLGVDRDSGLRTAFCRYAYQIKGKHYITADLQEELDLGKEVDHIFVVNGGACVLADREGSPRIAIHNFGKGKTVYFSGFKFSAQNTRLLHRAIGWATGAEADFRHWTCSNINTECAYYPGGKKLVVINNSSRKEETVVFDSKQNPISVSLEPHGIKIIEIK